MSRLIRGAYVALSSSLLVACSSADHGSAATAPDAGLTWDSGLPAGPLSPECGFFELARSRRRRRIRRASSTRFAPPTPTPSTSRSRSSSTAAQGSRRRRACSRTERGRSRSTRTKTPAPGRSPTARVGRRSPISSMSTCARQASPTRSARRRATRGRPCRPSRRSKTLPTSCARSSPSFNCTPELRANPVVLVGESYGGVRAKYFLDLVLRYSTQAVAGGPDLPGLLQSHFDAIFPARAGTAFDEATIATQFGAQVLIQPFVLGDPQSQAQLDLQPSDPYVGSNVPAFADGGAPDPYDVAQPMGWSDRLIATPRRRFRVRRRRRRSSVSL